MVEARQAPTGDDHDMHGMVNRSIEYFLRSTYGDVVWQEIARIAGIDLAGFNGMLHYPTRVTVALLRSSAQVLGKSGFEILEDTGAWLVRLEAMRRLLRFSGGEFLEFVFALEELPGRARLVLPDLDIPPLIITQPEPELFLISGPGWQAGLPWIISGALRGMADDYGVLALIEPSQKGVEMRVMMQEYAQSRPFDFALPTSGTALGQGK